MRHDPPPGPPTRRAYGRRDETCPISTGGGTRRVQLVREGGGGACRPCRARALQGRGRTSTGTRRVRLVREEGRDVYD